ncbi:tetratricopeptide repeat protein [Chitinispirillales bacterium ANBcel5]|uniref:tetratricopeptide repeat protein n=1 Tax=Cellulosispirillum alkaliphilum TaxID=3039283 RepID=UPI002A548B88|nr:tetratricopeptide repeat protein [Chitinispirillales bacterium ANBcel5]
MSKQRTIAQKALIFFLLLAVPFGLSADETLQNLMDAENYREALDYADEQIPPAQRTPEVWVKIAQANEKLGMIEKALAAYLVSSRMDANHYQSLLGAAKIYNSLGQSQNAMTFANRALEQDFTAEASWEYARACIDLDRSSDAKKALEKVIETDSANIIANRELGNIYINEGEYHRAIPLLKRALMEKEEGQILYSIGLAYVEIGVADSALAYLNAAVEKETNVSEASLLIARANFGLENYSEAARGFDNVQQDMMESMDYYMKAISKEQINDQQGAINAFSNAVSSFGESTEKEALFSREKVARNHLKNKDFGDALPHLEFIRNADENGEIVSDVYFLLADAHEGQQNSTEAIKHLERAIALNPNDVEGYARLADLYENNNMDQKAKETLEAMMALSPNDPSVFLSLGQYNLDAQRYEEALEHFETSNNLENSAAASEGIAIAAYNTENLQKAKSAATRALELDENRWEARKILADVLLTESDFQNAQGHFEALVEKEPRNMEFLVNLATCYYNTDSADELAETDKKIVELDQGNSESRLRLARYADENNDTETALSMYLDLAELTPEDAEVFRRLFHLHQQKGEKQASVDALRTYLELNPQDAVAQRDLGDALYEMDQLDGALVAYRAAIEIDPDIKGFYQRYAEIVIAKGEEGEVITALTGVIESGDADFSTYTTLGMIYQRRGNHEEAIDMYQDALQLDPTNTDALSALARSQAASGDVNGAIITYEQTVMMNSEAVEEYKELGELYQGQGREAEALRAFRRYLDRNPDDVELAKTVGEASFENEEFEDAAKYLEPVTKVSNDIELLIMYAEACFKSGRYSQAAQTIKEFRDRRLRVPTLRRMLMMLAQSYENDEDMENAAKAYLDYISVPGTEDADAAYKTANLHEEIDISKAITIYENNIKSYPQDFRNVLRLGLLYAEDEENQERAVALLEQSTEFADSLPEVWLEMAQVHGNLGNEDQELEAYQNYVQADPQHLEANKRIGILLMRKGEVNEALINLEIANTLEPNDPDVMAMLARGYISTERVEKAIELLEKAKVVRSDDPDIRYQLFQLYEKTGQTEKAQAEIEELVELQHDNRFLLMYAQALISQENFSDAEDALLDILATDPENIDALLLLARVQRKQENFEQALETYEEIEFIDRSHPRALYERAETYIEMSRFTWAETFYNRALRADPQFAVAKVGLARLAKVRRNEELYLQLLQEARELDPDDPEVLEELRKAGK